VGQETQVVHLSSWRKKFSANDSLRFLQDLRDNSFVAIVAYGNGRLTVFEHETSTEQLITMRTALDNTIKERESDANT
jgi:hypothetical protein